jgi:NAD(P)-dependent dehydrogenase (short-subunit alcohol dehydrogenase family)
MTGLGLKGKRVIVTGAAGGLGRPFAVAFADAGARIVATDVNISGADETARMIADSGGEAHACRVDVTDASSLAALALCARDKLGGLDCLVNNAAVMQDSRAKFRDDHRSRVGSRDGGQRQGAWMAIKATAPLLREAGGGAIINISSATVMSGSPMWLHYVSSKGAIIAMTRALARELGDDRITVNALAPGFTLTEASLDLIENAAEYGVARGAIKRAAAPHDMVGAALFLASTHAAFMTGQTLIVDGGRQFL